MIDSVEVNVSGRNITKVQGWVENTFALDFFAIWYCHVIGFILFSSQLFYSKIKFRRKNLSFILLIYSSYSKRFPSAILHTTYYIVSLIWQEIMIKLVLVYRTKHYDKLWCIESVVRTQYRVLSTNVNVLVRMLFPVESVM